MNLRPKIALYEPAIPQNTAASIRTCACLGADLEIIEPSGFLFSDKRFKRVVMDYMDKEVIKFYQSS
jgi:tRNA (cytidine/uridine-2'-O-)-methyltransferase